MQIEQIELENNELDHLRCQISDDMNVLKITGNVNSTWKQGIPSYIERLRELMVDCKDELSKRRFNKRYNALIAAFNEGRIEILNYFGGYADYDLDDDQMIVE